MTSNQINNAARKEQERANREREKETARANKAQEAETHRSNTEKERLNRNVEKRQQISTLSDILGSAIKTIREGVSSKINNVSSGVAAAGALAKLLNDPKWYEVTPQITKDVASISAFQPTGTIPAIDDSIGLKEDNLASTKVTEPEGHRFATAGYCHFTYLPTIGTSFFSSNNSDAVNITAQNLYSFMRMNVSGSVRNYERADYMMYLLSIDGPLSYYSWMKRLYGLLNYANLYNKYLPRHILTDMNIDYHDLSNQIANFRAYINQFAVRMNASIAIPTRFPYYARHQFLNTYMFSDSKSKKHQLYFFSPRKYFIWKVDPNNQATMLDLEDPWAYTGATTLTLDNIITFGNYMIETLLNEEDVGIMVGDTVKAFGEENLVKIPEVPENYVVEIGTSDEIMDQITNIRFAKKNVLGACKYPATNAAHWSIIGYEPSNSFAPATHTFAFNVYQNTTTQQIYQVANIHVKVDCTTMNSLAKGVWNNAARDLEEVVATCDTQDVVELNFLTDDTSPERVLTSTRLTPVIRCLGTSTVRDSAGLIQSLNADYEVTACGSEVVMEGYASILYWDANASEAKVATYNLYDGINEFNTTANSGGAEYGTGFTGEVQVISDFDWHPCINVYHTLSSGTQNLNVSKWLRRYSKLWDRNVSTYVPLKVMSDIHAAAIMGEFNLADLGLKPKSKI